MAERIKMLIMGAAGRDFHNFNVLYRSNPAYEVVAFTATQIPDIEGRRYPKELSGDLYPDGLPIYPEDDLERLIKELSVEQVLFSYSDVSNQYVMDMSARVNAAGAQFALPGAEQTMLKSNKPVVAICAVRTGCGKSQTARKVAEVLKAKGKRIVVIRHPMPYGDLTKQTVQRFAEIGDLDRYNTTIEEREEYEPHINRGSIVFAGSDYGAILREAEKEADVILWDGGNNDLPFYKPDLMITLVDPHRPGHELLYYPGTACAMLADVILVNKINTAKPEDVETVKKNAKQLNPGAVLIEADSPLTVDKPDELIGKRALVVEDGPTLTHGGMKYGAGVLAARKFGALELVDPRKWIVGSIVETYEKYPEIGTLLPAMGYGNGQIRDLEETINRVDCDVVVIGTPIDLTRILKINKPTVRVRYDLAERGSPTIEDVLSEI